MRWRRIRSNEKEQNKDLIRFRKGICNGLGNNFRRVKKGLLIRKEATEDGTVKRLV